MEDGQRPDSVSPEELEVVKRTIRDFVVGKGHGDFLMLSPRDRHFLFSMRSHYLDFVEQGKPLFCSKKQYKYLRDCIDKYKSDGGASKKIEDAFTASRSRVRKALSKLLSEESAKLSEELGMKRRAIRRRLDDEWPG